MCESQFFDNPECPSCRQDYTEPIDVIDYDGPTVFFCRACRAYFICTLENRKSIADETFDRR